MKDRTFELQVLIKQIDSLNDAQSNIQIIKNRKKKTTSEFLGNFRNNIFDDTNVAGISQSTSVENFEAAEIRENINLIAQNTEEIKKLHSKILSNARHKDKTRLEAKQKLDAVTIKIENSINIILEKMKLMENNILESVDGVYEAKLILRRNQAAILSKKFYEVISNFNKVESIFQNNFNNQIESINAALNHNTEADTSNCSREKSFFMKEFFSEVENVRYVLEDLIIDCVEKVKHLQSMMWINPSEDQETKKQLEEAILETEHLANAVMEKIKLIYNSILYDDGSLAETEMRIRKNHYNFLSSIFVEIMLEYNAAHANYHQRRRQRIQHWFHHTKEDVSDEELDEMIESGNFKILTFLDASEPYYADRLANIEARKNLSGYKSRNEMKRDLGYLKIIIFCINHQMTKSEKYFGAMGK